MNCRLTLRTLLEQPLHGTLEQLGAVAQPQLDADFLPMGFNRMYAQVQLFGDEARAVAMPNELEDLQLAIAQTFDSARGPGTEQRLASEPLRHVGAQIQLAAQ